MTEQTNTPQMGETPFPFGECAFYGFNGLKGSVWPFVIRVALPYFLLALVLAVAPMFFMGDYMRWIVTLENMDETSQLAQVFANFGRYSLGFLAMGLLSLIVYSASVNAGYRWYLNRDMSGQFGALRFGMDEVRTFLVSVFYFLFIFLVPYLALVILLIGIFGGVSAGGGDPENAGFAVLLVFLLIPAMIVFMVFFGIRLSLCVPLSLERKQFVFWDSMRLTKKRGWALLGAYLILGVVYIIVAMIVSTIGQILLLGNFFGIIMQAAESKVSDTQMINQIADSLSSPGAIASLILYGGLSAVVSTIFLFAFVGLTAYSMRFLQEEKGDIVGNLEVFD